MEKNTDLAQSLNVIKGVADKGSWFGEHAHRWAQASLPLAYAVACVEVVSKSSEKARVLFNGIIEAWGKPGTNILYEQIIAEVPDSEKEKIKNAFIHPEIALLPDPDKPFRDLEKILKYLVIDENKLEAGEDLKELNPEGLKELKSLITLFLEFILIGFNRESDIKKGRFKVIPNDQAPWLPFAIMIHTSFEYSNITIDRLRRIYKVKELKGKIIDFEKVLTEEPMSCLHRRMVAAGKAAKLKLKSDRIFLSAARHWYQSRVVYSSVTKYCEAQSKKGIMLDPKNIEKQIKPCDEAVGYRSRLPKNSQ